MSLDASGRQIRPASEGKASFQVIALDGVAQDCTTASWSVKAKSMAAMVKSMSPVKVTGLELYEMVTAASSSRAQSFRVLVALEFVLCQCLEFIVDYNGAGFRCDCGHLTSASRQTSRLGASPAHLETGALAALSGTPQLMSCLSGKCKLLFGREARM